MYFRTDMNAEIASGHVMRCLTIAECFKSYGENCVFLLSDDTAVDLIESRGFQAVVMNSSWNDLESELPYITAYLKEHNVHKIIIDSYSATVNYLQEINRVASVVYIDDQQREKLPVSVLIAFCLGDEGEKFLQETYSGEYPRLLIGSKFVPLRKEFKNIIAAKRTVLYDVMITTGGTDPYGMSEKIVELFRKLYPHLKLLVLSAKIDQGLSDDKLKVLPYSNQMADLMVSSKVVISAAGGTLNELCACRVPAISFSFADNQIAFAKRMHRLGAVIYMGDVRNNSAIALQLVEQTCMLLQDKDKYVEMVEKMESITDGYGADRIVKELMK